MNIIFFGTSEFAVASLQTLAKSAHKIQAVITRPDKKAGRGMQMQASPVKEAAEELGLLVYQPENLLSESAISALKLKPADIFVVIAYGEILKKQILDMPKRYCINLHASLLPKYRGAAPCNWAVINGEKRTGVTIIKLNEQMDAGDIITSQSVDISAGETSQDLDKQLALIGAETLLATIDLIEAKKEKLIKQDETYLTYAPKLTKKDGLIDWKKKAKQINNLIRGTQPWPSAYTYLDKMLLKIYKAKAEELLLETKPGLVAEVGKMSFTVACGEGALEILEVQLEGKRRMSAEEFLRGADLKAGQRLG
ncbi:MAG: methionyl-tRNA formyltransferase [Candidatus Omnitrophota bacterium]